MQGRLSFFLTIIALGLSVRLGFAGPLPRAVPPTLELIVLDPNADPVGNPAVEFQPGVPGQLQIDIPPMIIVHRFYYTGDRTFQGPFLKGGPTVVVANDPRTGERVYVPVQMPPGAPRVTYTSSSIVYDFGFQGVTLTFCKLAHRPTVAYRNHKKATQIVAKKVDHMVEQTKNLLDRSGISQATYILGTTSKNLAITAVDRTRDIAKFALRPVVQVGRLIPGVTALTSSQEEQAAHLREAQIQLRQMKNQTNQTFFPSGQ